MQSWNDIRCRANLWCLLDELPAQRMRPVDFYQPEHEAHRIRAWNVLDTWQRTGNMAHLGLGRKLGEGNFSRVYELGDELVVKITGITAIWFGNESSPRSEQAMAASGSLDMGVLYADFCLDHQHLDLLPVTYGYARHGDTWIIISERLEDAEMDRLRQLQGDADTIGLRMMEYLTQWPFQAYQWHLARAMNEMLRWANDANQFMPVYWDLHRSNVMLRDGMVPVLNDPFVTYAGPNN